MKKDLSKVKENILEFLDNEKNYLCMTVKQFAVIFSVPKEEIPEFEKAFLSLEKEGYIYIDDSKRICKINGNIFVCKYESKSYSFGFGIIKKTEGMQIIDKFKNVDKIYISRDNNGKATDGDIVLVKINDGEKVGDSYEGKVIKIITRAEKNVVGIFEKSQNFGFVKPLDRSMEDIYIPSKACIGIENNDRVSVRITKYGQENRKAEGKIIEVLGSEDTKGLEYLMVFAANNIKEEFSEQVLNEAEEVAKILPEDKIHRRDMTKDLVFTIDGDDAKDLDDAICIKQENNGYKVSVHIADVSHYVTEGSKINEEAIKRGTSIYTPGKVIPMLPRSLSNGICSLNEGEERLTLSVDIFLDSECKISGSDIYKSYICSKKRMTYSNVEKVLDKSDDTVLKEYADFITSLELMQDVANKLKADREKNGSINFDIPETKIVLDDNGEVIDVKPYEVGKSNYIIEEFMLLANKVVAETFCNLQTPFIYRVHETPDIQKLKETNEVLASMGASIKGINKIHPRALADVIEAFKGDNEKGRIISTLVLRSLKLARYSDECLGHFGLNFEYYTHFTSPIRRYPDLFIHRVISKYIDSGYMPDEKELGKLVAKAKAYALSSSDAEKLATKIEREMDDIFMAKYMKNNLGNEYHGIISGISKYGMYVKLENTVEGLVTLNSMEDDYYIYDEKLMRLVGRRTSKIYSIGQEVDVLVVRADELSKQIDFVLCGGISENGKKK